MVRDFSATLSPLRCRRAGCAGLARQQLTL